MKKYQTMQLTTVAESYIGFDLEADGTLTVTSSFSEEATKQLLPQLFPAWMFEVDTLQEPSTAWDESMAFKFPQQLSLPKGSKQ